MKTLAIALACAALAFAAGCAGCGDCGYGAKPAVPGQAEGVRGGRDFGGETYVWELWEYGTNRVEKTR